MRWTLLEKIGKSKTGVQVENIIVKKALDAIILS